MKLKLLDSSDPENLVMCYFWARKMEIEHAKGGCAVCRKRLKEAKII